MLERGHGECKGPEFGEDLAEAETERWTPWLRSSRQGGGGGDRAGGVSGQVRMKVG